MNYLYMLCIYRYTKTDISHILCISYILTVYTHKNKSKKRTKKRLKKKRFLGNPCFSPKQSLINRSKKVLTILSLVSLQH